MDRKEVKGVTILGYADSYQMFAAGGKTMQRNVKVHIAKGVKIYAVGYACMTDEMVVFNDEMDAVKIYNGNTPEVVEDYEYGNDCSYHDLFRKVDKLACPISQKFGIGTYYDESGELISDEIIQKSLIHANAVVAKQAEWDQQTKEAAARKFAEDKANYAKRYPYLTPAKDGYDYKTASANLRALLKAEFPGVKFKVHKTYSSSSDSISIEWTDGPTRWEVEKVADLFKNAFCGDSMTDYFEYECTNFTSIYGGFDYMHYDREMSDEVRVICQDRCAKAIADNGERNASAELVFELEKECGEHVNNFNDPNIKTMPYWYFRNKSFYVKPEPKAAKAPNTAKVEGAAVEIVDYSEKAIAVIGDTAAIKDSLKSLGGRFNAKLKCGAGWIFSKRKESEVRAALAM